MIDGEIASYVERERERERPRKRGETDRDRVTYLLHFKTSLLLFQCLSLVEVDEDC